MSDLEHQLALQIRALKLPEPEREYRFAMHHIGRGKGIRERLVKAGLKDWRFDFAWPSAFLAVEIEGGGWVRGRHNRPVGFRDDMRKYHAAMGLGWTVYRCDGELVSSGQAVELIERLLAAKNRPVCRIEQGFVALKAQEG